jgi:hypothetical protein
MNTYTKICSTCKTLKSITSFSKRKTSKDGCRGECKSCVNAYNKKYKSDNRLLIHEYNKKYHEDNKCILNPRRQTYRKENKELIRLQRREHDRKYKNKRKATDPLYRFKLNVGSLIRNYISKKGFIKNTKTIEILGCTYDEFKDHIEKQFTEGMSWDNRSEWHLDHIKPISLATTEEEIIALNHYTNFQPLWAEDNLKKSNKFQELL